MPTFEESLQKSYDERLNTLAKIKARSLGADGLQLTAMTVLTYAQLEGGAKDLCAYTIRQVNLRNLQIGELAPRLLQWRNPAELDRFKSSSNFEVLTSISPFANALQRKVKIRSINRRYEFNQMSWEALKTIYRGFGLDDSSVSHRASEVDQLVEARNQAAHYGVLPTFASAMAEAQLRANVAAVEDVLTDLTIQLLSFFANRMHLR